MSTAAISGNLNAIPLTPPTRQTPEAAEVRKAGPDQDRDKDDQRAAAAPPTPSVNTQGQTVGRLINTAA